MSVEKEVKLTIPMLPDMELAATRLSEALAEHIQMDEEKKAEVSLAVIEACINAFEHSNSIDRNIYITFTVSPHSLKVELKDKGSGFEPSTIPMPDISKKITGKDKKRGWGLHLMKTLMDDVSVESSNEGTIIKMEKHI